MRRRGNMTEYGNLWEHPTDDRGYAVRKNREKVQRRVGAAPSEGMPLATTLQQEIAKNAPSRCVGSQSAPTSMKEANPVTEGCFIATICYGNYDHPAVQEFRWFRDARLNQRRWGRRFIAAYYRVSPQSRTSFGNDQSWPLRFADAFLNQFFVFSSWRERDTGHEQ